jgi:polar amino acid transport system ATP-binding protein
VEPQFLLFDEPTSALDPEMTAEVLEAIEQLKREGRRFVLVTHAMGFARRVADVVAFLASGRILELAEPRILFESPTTSECRAFLSRVLRY